MMTNHVVKDSVNQVLIDCENKIGIQELGMMANQVWYDDPRRLVFTLARYKFVSKMLSGRQNVFEIGCGDGFASRLVRQEVANLTISDFDPLFIERFQASTLERWQTSAVVHDILQGAPPGRYDAIYSLDVLEHIPAQQEDRFLLNTIEALDDHGVVIFGMPSLESQGWASPPSRAGHVNCKTGKDFKALLDRYFHAVFMFSMNDEVVHTGFFPMAHYLIGVCAHKKLIRASS